MYARKHTQRTSCAFLVAAHEGFKHASRGIQLFRFYGVALLKSDLRETFYERTFPGYSRFVRPDVPALWSRHDYDNNVHNTTIYSQTLSL